MKQFLASRRFKPLGVVIAGLGIALLSGAPAQAAVISTDACDNAALTQPFERWGDSSLYKLAPGGSFDTAGTNWSLSGGASLRDGGEPYAADGSVSSASLNLPAGASAQSPYTCVDAAYPTFRFFGRNNGLLSTVLVSVVYRLPVLGEVAVPVGVVALSGQWEPSLTMLTASAVPGLLANGTADVAIRVTALTGDSQIDDVFIDPRMHD
jgi:hypothetical protein